MRTPNFLLGCALLLAAAPVYADIYPSDVPSSIPTTVIIELNDNHNTMFELSFVSVIGTTWTYHLEELSGRSLSHWDLGLPCCLFDDLVETDPDAQIGEDASTGFIGLKWEVDDGFTAGDFWFTLDEEYKLGAIEVLVKAGNDYAIAGAIAGPICEPPDDPKIPLPGATLLGLIGLTTLAGIKRRFR